MKRALALLLFVGMLGLSGIAQITGTWDVTLSFEPSALTSFGFTACHGSLPVVDLSSSLTLSYEFATLTFSSISAFSVSGFDSQKFTLVGSLGPVSVDVTMKFIPTAVTKYEYIISGAFIEEVQTGHYAAKDWWCCNIDTRPVEYAPKFDDILAKASMDFAGLGIEVLAFLERGNYDKEYEGFFTLSGKYLTGTVAWDDTQTESTCTAYKNGLGTRWKVSAELNGITITSYTYFNLTEYSKAAAMARSVALGGGYLTDLYLGKSDSGFKIVSDTCAPGFTEEYLLLEGMSLCCGASLDAALTITCDGFKSLEVLLNDVPFLCCGMSFDALFTFDINSKSYQLKPKITADWACVVFDVGVDFSDHQVAGISVYGISFTCELGECLKIYSDTSFDSLNTNYHPIASPVTGGKKAWYLQPVIKCGTSANNPDVVSGNLNEIEDGLLLPYCMDEELYHIWEKFGVDVCLPGCCGDTVTFSSVVYFGDKYELAGYGFAYYDASAGKWAYYWTDTVGSEPSAVNLTTFAGKYKDATGSTWTETSKTKDTLVPVEYYKAATNDNLFGWVKATTSLTVPLSSAIDITISSTFSVFGLEDVSLKFSLTF